MRSVKNKTWLHATGIIILFILIGTSIYGYSFYKSLTKSIETMHQPIDREKSVKRQEEITLTKKDPFSVLVLGVDEREGDRGRSDTIIVLTVNPNLNSVKILSIPRDTRTEIIGHSTVDKINHAYAFGGVEMSIATVESFLDIPIDYFIQINMEGFTEIINSVGGVTVNNDLEFTNVDQHFPKGEITLNGEQALSFSRMRYEDPRGDFGRQLRQRQIIQAVLKKGASISSLANYKEIFQALGNNIKTNLKFEEMIDIQKNYRTAVKTVEQSSINGSGTKIDSIYYFIVPDEEKERVQAEMKEHLK
ncbi:polyisoprenyl-teichoic acid--peptidoglycan teichoic acid transferase TagU [Cytobacillus dafuensis]|uniref:Polyisoprenyl-teichoic acid--peptidoglycan teichoic acid transferase TagU n=1 Tax=Cytobacillus dafuensis TaxID=1742359 RepID=A0A5B8Z8C4_CYTDA|nr:LytR family transcriptional regulator [Cytobacillus dafuensis]QED48533.1 LytR family transcriptional regulator [Cytobacillus dafuensis]